MDKYNEIMSQIKHKLLYIEDEDIEEQIGPLLKKLAEVSEENKEMVEAEKRFLQIITKINDKKYFFKNLMVKINVYCQIGLLNWLDRPLTDMYKGVP